MAKDYASANESLEKNRLKKDKISFSSTSHLSNSVVDLPEFVFNTEKLKIANAKLPENIFENKNYISPVITNHLEKKENEGNSLLSKNANSATGILNKNEVQLQNVNKVDASKFNAAEGKINDKKVSDGIKTKSDISAPSNNAKQVYKPQTPKETVASPQIHKKIVIEKTEEETFFSKLKGSFVLFISMIALKISDLIIFNPAINAQSNQKTNLTGNSIAIIFAGLAAVVFIFIILWQKVFKLQKGKEAEAPESKATKAKNSRKRNASTKNKEILESPSAEITIPIDTPAAKFENKSDETVILLKGRTKKVPRSINYNELFVNHLNEKTESSFNNRHNNNLNNDLNKNLNNNYYNCIYENPNEEKSSNFEDFFDKINENKKVLEILNQQTEKLSLSGNNQQQQIMCNNFVPSGVDLWESENKKEKNCLLENLNKNANNNLIGSNANKETCSIVIPNKDLDESKDVLNTSQNRSFSDTKERLKHNNLLSKTPISTLLRANNHY